MSPRKIAIVPLHEMTQGQEGDVFALMTEKQELKTRDGKPYFRVGFRDNKRETSFPVWSDSPWAADCRDAWTPGAFYKIRAVYRETQYGPQLEIRKIREVTDDDRADGFDPGMCLPSSRREPSEMFDELLDLMKQEVEDASLQQLVLAILTEHRDALLEGAAAQRHHHTYRGGLIEHMLSVVRNAVFFATKYTEDYPDLTPPLNRSLVVVGAALHDIGKLRELAQLPTGVEYSPEGVLIGHITLGRDIIREFAAREDLAIDPELQLRLEHLILSHQRLPEWGSPKPPMTPEAILVHFSDDVDAKFNGMALIFEADSTPGPFTSTQNPLRQRFYRGENS